MSDIQMFIKDSDDEGIWVDANEENLDLSVHDAKIRDQAIDEFESLLYQFGYYDAFAMKFEIYHDDLNRLIQQLKEQK